MAMTTMRRVLSGMLTLGLTMPFAFATTAQAADPTPEPSAHYNMTHDGEKLLDVTPNARHATLVGVDEAGFGQYANMNGLTFDGDGYVALPQGLVTGSDNDFSVEMTMTASKAQNQFAWVLGDGIGPWNTTQLGNHVFMNPSASSHEQGQIFGGIRVKTGDGNGEVRVMSDRKLAAGTINTVTMVGSGNTLTIYNNGEQIAQATHDYSMSSIIPQGETLGYLARSLYSPDPLFEGTVVDVKFWDDALTAEQVASSVPDQLTKDDTLGEIIQPKILPLLLNQNTSVDLITSNVTPPSLVDGVTLTWESSNPAVISQDGTVTRPKDQDVVVTMTATGLNGRTYSYQLTVPAMNEQSAIAADLDAIELPVAAHENLPLFAEGQVNGSKIVWTSSDPALVTPTDTGYVAPAAGASDPFAGAGRVARPTYGSGDASVTLTATATLGGTTLTRDYTVTIEELGRKAPDAGYAAAYFMGDSSSPRADEKIYEAYTTENDFFTFVEANDKQPVLTSTTDRKGLRDPYILRSHNGDRYYMVATDLCIGCGQSWGDAQSQGSLKIEVWESKDLVNWTRTNAPEDTGITVNKPEAGMTWAPEAYWDDELESYVVFFSSRVYDDPQHTSIDSYHAQIFYVLTRDFKTFTYPPDMWQDTGFSRIDSTVMKIDDHYYRWTKNEEGGAADGLERGKDIFMEKSKVLTAATTASDWNADPSQTWQLTDTAMTSKVTGQAGEGPEIVRLNEGDPNNPDGDGYVFLVDNYGAGGYQSFITSASKIAASSQSNRLSNQADWKVYDPAADGKTGLPERPRHGAFVNVPQTVLDAMASWTGIEAVASTVQASEAADGTVSVVVTAEDQGQVAGTVSVRGANTSLTLTLVDGKAEFKVPEAETGSLQIKYNGYRDQLVTPSSSLFTPTGSSTDAPVLAPIAEYDFTVAPADGKTVENQVDGSAFGPAIVENSAQAVFDGAALQLPGGTKSSTGTWVRLPEDILANATSATIQTEVKAAEAMRMKHHFLWNIGNDSNSEYLFSSLTCRDGRSAAVGLKTEPGNDYFYKSAGCDFHADEWVSVTAVVDGDSSPVVGKLYMNGKLVAEGSFGTQSVKDVSDQSLNTIGRSPWPDELFAGAVANFRVWDQAIPAEQVMAISEADGLLHADEIKASALQRLEGITLPSDVETSKVTLPTQNGQVTWTSSNPDIIAPDGTVVRPAADQGPATVTLTAAVTLRGQTATKSHEIKVAPELPDATKVQLDTEALAIHNADNMRSNFAVPTVGENGSEITWEIIDAGSTGAVLEAGVKDTAQTVKVSRPAAGAEDATMVLRATVTKGDAVETKDFTVTVRAIATDTSEHEAYIWTFFTGEGDGAEQVSIAASRGNDALAWNTLNDGQPVFTSTFGEQGLRDPFIMRSHDGDRFYMLATDLKIAGREGGFGGAQANGSLYLEIWESDDLVNWSEQRHVKVSTDYAGNTWAPEAFWSDEIGKYIVYWASNLHPTTNPDDRSGPTYNRMMYAVTDDFVTFSEAKPWIDMHSDNQWGTIDVSVAKENGVYYRFYKDEDLDMTVRLEKSTDLLDTFEGSDSLPTTQDDPTKWSLMQEEIGSGLSNGAGGTFRSGEGPSIFPSNKNDVNGFNWFLFIDQPGYHGGPNHYVPFATTDALADIDGASWTAVGEKLRANLPQNSDGGKPRHGTVIPVTRAEYERVLNAYQPSIAVASIEAMAVETDVDVLPTLPSEASLTMADGSTQTVAVEWDVVESAQVAIPGTFVVQGIAQDASRAPVEVEVTVAGAAEEQECVPTVATAIEKLVGRATNVWGSAPECVGATVVVELLQGGEWVSLGETVVSPSGSYVFALPSEVNPVGKYELRARIGEATSPSASLRRVAATTRTAAKLAVVGRDAYVWGTVDGSAKVSTQVWIPGRGWSTSQVREVTGGYLIPLTYGRQTAGDYQWRLVVQHDHGETEFTPTFFQTRVARPTATASDSAPSGRTANVWGTVQPNAEVWVEVQLRDGRWAKSNVTTADARGGYVMELTYGKDARGTFSFRVGSRVDGLGTLYSNEFTFTRT